MREHARATDTVELAARLRDCTETEWKKRIKYREELVVPLTPIAICKGGGEEDRK